jgi:hypothetical protein
MTTPTSSVNNRSRYETIISQTSREASLCRIFHTGFTAITVSRYRNNPLYCFQFTKFQRRAWTYQTDNQNPYIEEQTRQWPKEKAQKDKQRSTKHTHKAYDRVIRILLKPGGELSCTGSVCSSCSTCGTIHVKLKHKW